MVGPHQRLLLAAQLRHIDYLDQEIARLDLEVEKRMRPFDAELALLDTITGVGRRTSQVILGYAGPDMSRFQSAPHLCSWAGVAPSNNESAGKRKSGKTTKGNPLLRSALIQATRDAAHTKNTYLSALYHRIAARRGANRAAVAVAHSILVSAYHMLIRKVPYHDLSGDYFEKRNSAAVANRAIKQLEQLGYRVSIEPAS